MTHAHVKMALSNGFHSLPLDLFQDPLMDHLGVADMIALQCTCTHGHKLVSASRHEWLLRLHVWIRSRLRDWANYSVMLFDDPSDTMEYKYISGSALLYLVNREPWKPRNVNRFVIRAPDCSLSAPIFDCSDQMKLPIQIFTCNATDAKEWKGIQARQSMAIRREVTARMDLEWIRMAYDGQHLYLFNIWALVTRQAPQPVAEATPSLAYLPLCSNRYQARGFTFLESSTPPRSPSAWHTLLRDVFASHVMNHLGLGDMVALQRTCKHGHYLVSHVRVFFLSNLHDFMKRRLLEWTGYDVVEILRTNNMVPSRFAILSGSALLVLLNRETWTPNDVDLFRDCRESFSRQEPHAPKTIETLGLRWQENQRDGYPNAFRSFLTSQPNKIPLNLLAGYFPGTGVGTAPPDWMLTCMDFDFVQNTYDGQNLRIRHLESIVYRFSLQKGQQSTNPDPSFAMERKIRRRERFMNRGFSVPEGSSEYFSLGDAIARDLTPSFL